jgi:PAS domain S-box-containing protein
LSSIVEGSDDAIIGKDLNSIITSWNKGAERIFGYTASEMVGTSIMRLIPDDRREEETHILGKIGRGENVEHFETRRLTKDGRLIDVSVTASPIRAASGEVTGVSKVARDITARKLAEKTQQKERDFISAVVNTVGSLVVVIDREANIIQFNRACEQLTGYSFEEVQGRNLIDLFILPEERASTTHEFKNLCAGQFPNTYENHWVTRQGIPRVIAWSNTALIDANAEVEYVIGTGNDITERKRAEAQIEEQAAFLDKARDAILARDLEGKILFWNSGAERIYGWTRQEVMGRNIGGLLYADPGKFEEFNGRTISQGEWHGELQHLTKDKGEITIEARWTLIRDNEGNPKSVLAINTDITEKKKIEAQFMRAQRMESIGTLAGGVAHDLNNILTPIMMAIEILQELSTHPQAKNILKTIELSAKRGADIVRQVLSFARGLEGQRIEVQPKHLLKDLENIIKDTFPKDIRMQFSVPNDIWTILGDPTQVHQILLNLCVNARDAMPNGGALTIGVENCALDEQYAAMHIQAKPGCYVKISVTDSGTGIPPDLIDKIFEPFFTTKALNKGTGLGLSTVMAIVKSHDGIVNVYSETGKGTTFNVYLPAMESSTEARKEQTAAANLPRGSGETVLVVDDEASVLTITKQTLQAFGYRVVTAMDGADALSVYVQHRNEIAVVLTDMMMPVLDGSATIQALMRINPAIKIIAASGLNTNGGEALVASAGVKHFLTKPYTAATLLRTIRTILDKSD